MATGSIPATHWPRLLAFAEGRLPALTRLKQVEPLPIVLDRRRIYVVPTRFGLLFSAVLLVMLLGALNYNNNPALLLTFLLGAASFQSVFQAFRTLHRLQLQVLRADACHAGDNLRIHLNFHNDARPRHSLRVAAGDAETVFDLDRVGSGNVTIEVPAPQRGWQRPGCLRLSSEYPFGLFHVWSWLNPDFTALIYPRLETDVPALPHATAETAQQAVRRSGDELAALRDYRPTDPLRNIAWKASARHDTLLVKEFEQFRGRDLVLDYAALRGLSGEARITRLARWVCMAESAQVRYTLLLPGLRINPGLGADHRHACLRALALLPGAAT